LSSGEEPNPPTTTSANRSSKVIWSQLHRQDGTGNSTLALPKMILSRYLPWKI